VKSTLYSVIILVIALLSLASTVYYGLSFALLVTLLIMLLDKVGKGIILRETISFLYVLTCLIMPIIGYEYYSINNGLSRLWVSYMPIKAEVYFSYALPATSFFCFVLTLPMSKLKNNEEGVGVTALVERVKAILKSQKKVGLWIMAVGVVISFAINHLPAGLQFFATLFFFGSFAGFLYVYYTPAIKYRVVVLTLFALFIFYGALAAGMFTIVAYMTITIFSFLMLGKKTSLFKKIMIFSIGAFFLIVLQNVKLTFRKFTWQSEYGGNKVALFSSLFWENIQKGDALIETEAFFPIYTRGNQGRNVALVIRRMPAIKNFDGGRNLSTAFLSAFVPRLLWPDKPLAGGQYNMEYYTGWAIRGWSTDVGPLGEAYGSFGRDGGIIYMVFLGLFIRAVYVKVFTISRNLPLLICWLPVLFFQVISSAETDSLQIFNSLVKSSFFLWILFKFFPHWFGAKKVTKLPKPLTEKEF
jgi:hypothetical protein